MFMLYRRSTEIKRNTEISQVYNIIVKHHRIVAWFSRKPGHSSVVFIFAMYRKRVQNLRPCPIFGIKLPNWWTLARIITKKQENKCTIVDKKIY